MQYVGEGPRGSNGTCSTLCRVSVTPSATHNQIVPLWCWFPSGWACARSRPLWVSPTTSPVRLGVSPAAASTPMGVFNQRFEALFPHAGALGYMVCFAPPPLVPVYLCANVGSQGLLVVGLPAQFIPHSASLGQATSTRVLSAWLPNSAPPTSLDECFFLSTWCWTSLPFDFLSILVVRGGAVCLPTPPSWFSARTKFLEIIELKFLLSCWDILRALLFPTSFPFD